MREIAIDKRTFHSVLGPLMEKFHQERIACGYRSESGMYWIESFDRFLIREGLSEQKLSKELVERWSAIRPHESRETHRGRKSAVRQFCLFLFRQGIPTYVSTGYDGPRTRSPFVARIFTREEVRGILTRVDAIPSTGRTTNRNLIMPEIFRLLYCCGLRRSEVVWLRVKDVDLTEGILLIRNTKFGKDRLVPTAPSMAERLRIYASQMGKRSGDDFFFPSPYGGPYSPRTVYGLFRDILHELKIPHGGRGRGPRLHDLRHTFAVHRLAKWLHESADLDVKLPILATYMGHKELAGTQKYLQLTADMFPDLTTMFEKKYGHVFPRRCES